MRRALAAILLISGTASAEVLAARPVAKGELLSAEDLIGESAELSALVGKVARRPLFEGRRVRPVDVETKTAVMRQDSVSVVFRRGALTLQMEGRALQKGRVGDVVSISLKGRREPLSATVVAPGTVEVGA